MFGLLDRAAGCPLRWRRWCGCGGPTLSKPLATTRNKAADLSRTVSGSLSSNIARLLGWMKYKDLSTNNRRAEMEHELELN